MKTSIFIAACGATLAFSCATTRAQDVTRVPDTNQDVNVVDASVHTDIDERMKQHPKASKQPDKRPTTYSRWAFQTTNQHPTTRFGSSKITAPAAAPDATDRQNPSNPDGTLFQAGAISPEHTFWPVQTTTSSNNLQTDDYARRVGRQPDFFGRVSVLTSLDGFSTPFRERQFGTSTSSLSNLSNVFPTESFSLSSDLASAKRRKSHVQKCCNRGIPGGPRKASCFSTNRTPK
jgi:hypothetical protein